MIYRYIFADKENFAMGDNTEAEDIRLYGDDGFDVGGGDVCGTTWRGSGPLILPPALV